MWQLRLAGLAALCILAGHTNMALASPVELESSGKPIYIESIEIEDERKKDNWAGSLTLGLAIAPAYLGANEHTGTTVLHLKASYKDTIFIDNNTIGAVVHSSRFLRAGLVGRWNLGREDDEPLRLATGAEEVGDTFELGAFAATSLYKFFLAGEAYVGLSGVHRGVNVELEGGYTFELNSRFKVTPVLGVKWGSRDFTDAFFGVENDNPAFPTYQGTSGVYETYGEASAEYRLGKNWLVKGSARLAQLRNSAARSPIVNSDTGSIYQLSTYLGIVWLF